MSELFHLGLKKIGNKRVGWNWPLGISELNHAADYYHRNQWICFAVVLNPKSCKLWKILTPHHLYTMPPDGHWLPEAVNRDEDACAWNILLSCPTAASVAIVLRCNLYSVHASELNSVQKKPHRSSLIIAERIHQSWCYNFSRKSVSLSGRLGSEGQSAAEFGRWTRLLSGHNMTKNLVLADCLYR